MPGDGGGRGRGRGRAGGRAERSGGWAQVEVHVPAWVGIDAALEALRPVLDKYERLSRAGTRSPPDAHRPPRILMRAHTVTHPQTLTRTCALTHNLACTRTRARTPARARTHTHRRKGPDTSEGVCARSFAKASPAPAAGASRHYCIILCRISGWQTCRTSSGRIASGGAWPTSSSRCRRASESPPPHPPPPPRPPPHSYTQDCRTRQA